MNVSERNRFVAIIMSHYRKNSIWCTRHLIILCGYLNAWEAAFLEKGLFISHGISVWPDIKLKNSLDDLINLNNAGERSVSEYQCRLVMCYHLICSGVLVPPLDAFGQGLNVYRCLQVTSSRRKAALQVSYTTYLFRFVRYS